MIFKGSLACGICKKIILVRSFKSIHKGCIMASGGLRKGGERKGRDAPESHVLYPHLWPLLHISLLS